MADGHRKLLNDTRLSSWRSRDRRRLLVVGVGLGLVGYPLGSLMDWPVVSLIALLLFVTSWLMVRVTTRGVADLPDSVLDERQVGVRDRSYLYAYRLIGGALAVGALALIACDAMRMKTVSTEVVQVAFSFCLFLALAAPGCIVAWLEKEA
jgi:uncharacterized membrane protein